MALKLAGRGHHRQLEVRATAARVVFKVDAPGKDRPNYWGAYNPGNGEPIVRINGPGDRAYTSRNASAVA